MSVQEMVHGTNDPFEDHVPGYVVPKTKNLLGIHVAIHAKPVRVSMIDQITKQKKLIPSPQTYSKI